MKVHVYNNENKLIEVIQNVIKIKNCSDGRTLITHEKKCECCNIISNFILQCPPNYDTMIFLENLDEINLCR